MDESGSLHSDQPLASAGPGLGMWRIALGSVGHFLSLLARGRLHQPDARLEVTVSDAVGFHYLVRRETAVSGAGEGPTPTVLLVWFRLRFVRSGESLLNGLFWILNYATIPFFSGVPGFRIKLWMEDRKRADYLGIYEFASEGTASSYARYMSRILGFFSVPGSIASQIVKQETVTDYLATHGDGGDPIPSRPGWTG